ncbi:mitochondrial mRNA pseudouridine synthase TRUB2 isoform X1 [Gadus chalcogrammus]|uniref:mitochondrial mRNA pseudouridine synthase TRUB2 isoform X1 n=1 Tax=Gadus chalcogrammus TaxID=1042646 RepID=UPI0024C3A690|nr:mitochondrial mRNA pseudouridine synthase TRUB2 isoform X1 [Gadus chalcogrammus]
MAIRAIRKFRWVEGLFCVYKPPGVHWKLVRDRIETCILEGVNGTPSLAPRVGLLGPGGGRTDLTLTAGSLPPGVRLLGPGRGPTELTLSASSLAAHPLVRGPEFRRIKVGVGHRLDASSSGVLVIGVGRGNKPLNDLYQMCCTRDYTLEGEFGFATDNFSRTGRIVERSTYDHVTRDKLEKVLAMLQQANQKALLIHSNVDMRSQEAYEMAVTGELGPQGKSPPILTGLRVTGFQPPFFTLELQCLNETQRYLRKVVHEIGLELRSTASCTAVRRTRDGPFTVDQALTRGQWTAAQVALTIQHYNNSKRQSRLLPAPAAL